MSARRYRLDAAARAASFQARVRTAPLSPQIPLRPFEYFCRQVWVGDDPRQLHAPTMVDSATIASPRASLEPAAASATKANNVFWTFVATASSITQFAPHVHLQVINY
jgi:hypothetical protein